MAGNFSYWIKAVLNGLGQIAFADRPLSGLLVLAGFFAIAPWGAAGALAGALFGAATARLMKTWSPVETGHGLAGANLAIVGASFAFVASEALQPLIIVLAVAACLGIEAVVRRLLQPVGLPPLSLPAVLTLLLLTGLYDAFGKPFWDVSSVVAADTLAIVVPVALFAAAMVVKSWRAAILTGLLTAAAALLSGSLLNGGWLGPAGLWAFAVAPAAFGIHAVFLAGSRIGAVAGCGAALIGAGLWFAWMASPLGAAMPPLLLPFILATWIVLSAVRLWAGPAILDPHIWAAVEELRHARAAGRPAVVLTGAGISTASGIPDYASGAWLDPKVPIGTYSYDRFVESQNCRQLYWDACSHFRDVVANTAPNPGHRALACMEAKGWLGPTITQNVDRLHQAAGAREVIELHGRIDQVRCLGCGEVNDWPPAQIWRKFDLACQACGGFLKPAVIAMGESVPHTAWERAEAAVKDCGAIMVVGSQMAITSAAELLARARAHGAKVIYINLGDTASGMAPGDLVLNARAEVALPAIAALLGCYPVTGRQGAETTTLPSQATSDAAVEHAAN
jgi:NAD-dependent SIR2 family protein deacetylase/urea transporter